MPDTHMDVDSAGGKRGIRKKVKEPRPNYFLGVRISNKQVLEAALDVQKNIVEAHPSLDACRIDVEKRLHVTISAFHLTKSVNCIPDETRTVQNAIRIVRELMAPTLKKILGGTAPTLTFVGLDAFATSVVFLNPEQNADFAHFVSFCNAANRVLLENDILENIPTIHPHATLFKTSKAARLKSRSRKFKIEREKWETHSSVFWGHKSSRHLICCR